jgi:hypothetical protein
VGFNQGAKHLEGATGAPYFLVLSVFSAIRGRDFQQSEPTNAPHGTSAEQERPVSTAIS